MYTIHNLILCVLPLPLLAFYFFLLDTVKIIVYEHCHIQTNKFKKNETFKIKEWWSVVKLWIIGHFMSIDDGRMHFYGDTYDTKVVESTMHCSWRAR